MNGTFGISGIGLIWQVTVAQWCFQGQKLRFVNLIKMSDFLFDIVSNRSIIEI